MEYQCPLCHQAMPHDLLIILQHGDTHIVEKIKEQNPQWTDSEGICKKCYEYYKKELSH